MRKELIDTKARIPVLESQVEKLHLAHDREVKKADDCHRRAVQAQTIADDETVEVALRFEAKHRVAVEVWVQKIEAAEADLGMQRQTASEMTEQLKEARSNREVLEIRTRRARRHRTHASGRSSVDELDRLADELERGDDLGAAERAVERELDPTYGADEFDRDLGDAARPSMSREERAERQLEELKRQMKEDGNRNG